MSLSDKIDYSPDTSDCVFGVLATEDVKEFIKELKDNFNDVDTELDYSGHEIRLIIDRLAGDALTK